MASINLENLQAEEERKRLEESKIKENIISKDFEWENDFFNHMNRTTYNFAKRLVDSGLIKDVYLDMNDEKNHYITIEYRFSCDNDLKDISHAVKKFQQGQAPIYRYRIPDTFKKITSETGCAKRFERGCEFYGCPILIAGYIFHMTKNLHKPVKDPNISEYKEVKEEKKETLQEILTPTLVEKRNEILNEIKENIYLDKNVKAEFCKLIRTLYNYDGLKDSI